MNNYDIIIVGSGPAGSACALSLKGSGRKVLVIDKCVFPRDKICGDAIPNTVPKALRILDEKYLAALRAFPEKVGIDSCKVVAPSGKSVTLQFKLEGYASTRMDFDNFMVTLAQKESQATFVFGEGITDVTIQNDFVEVTSDKGNRYFSKLIIGCDGAHSVLNKKLTTTKVDHNHYIGAVRAYYKNVKGLQPNTMEIHLVKGYMPGYFWIFPLTNNTCNTGFGMVSSSIASKKINLRKSLLDIVENSESIRERFSEAVAMENPIGYGLPTGSRKVQISGDRFMLAGDAASLIDPATGEGIGNAMISGIKAGQHTLKCFSENNFSAPFMKHYDDAIHKYFWNDMKNKYRMQRMVGKKAWLADFAIRLASDVPWIKTKLQKLF